MYSHFIQFTIPRIGQGLVGLLLYLNFLQLPCFVWLRDSLPLLFWGLPLLLGKAHQPDDPDALAACQNGHGDFNGLLAVVAAGAVPADGLVAGPVDHLQPPGSQHLPVGIALPGHILPHPGGKQAGACHPEQGGVRHLHVHAGYLRHDLGVFLHGIPDLTQDGFHRLPSHLRRFSFIIGQPGGFCNSGHSSV